MNTRTNRPNKTKIAQAAQTTEASPIIAPPMPGWGERVRVVFVTPEIAQAWVDRNTTNRALRKWMVEQYETDMKRYKWWGPSAIIILEDGTLGDGQHRLYAIIKSGVGQWLIVIEGVKRSELLNIDTQRPRHFADNVVISGSVVDATKQLCAVTRAIAEGARSGRAHTFTDRVAMVTEHREAAEWAINHAPRRQRMRGSIVLGAIGRAWYVEQDLRRLARFCEVLDTGQSTLPDESAAIVLRDMLMGSNVEVSNRSEFSDYFRRTQKAIHYFMHGTPITKLGSCVCEAYPLKPRCNDKRECIDLLRKAA